MVSVKGAAMLIGVALLLGLSACEGASPTPGPTVPPAAGVVLQKILNDCWGVTQMGELDGNRPDHVKAFECARTRLLQMGQQYPEAAEPHRVLAWGYLYALRDEVSAQAEYERAERIYAAQGRSTDQADILVRIAVQFVMTQNAQRGCELLQQAAGLDPGNARITTLQQNFNCIPRLPVTTPGPTPAATPTVPVTSS